MFIDEAKIMVKGGHGGAGRVAFFRNKKGPSGGNGGPGGNVYAVASSNLTQLETFISRIKYIGENGGPGGPNQRTGKYGDDLLIKVPIGTTFIDVVTKGEITINEKSPKFLLCRGGLGGLGNSAFKSPTNRVPQHAEQGHEGQERNFKLILRLIANFGLIGLPNAGKSSLLNKLTAANVRTANYPFTTLEPNLGVYNEKILADVPGLIEGASTGKGLGIKFLKHIEKVDVIFHCISVESQNLAAEYKTVINELKTYNSRLLEKKSIILLTKIDLIDNLEITKKVKELKKFNKEVLPVSIYDEESLNKLKKFLISN
ncbi:MAG: GTPase ObgE [Candidatus Roizmanbacteria bacterium]|nr:GTPase ObgE [Candidatus Roizmanbacteria bacterium]